MLLQISGYSRMALAPNTNGLGNSADIVTVT